MKTVTSVEEFWKLVNAVNGSGENDKKIENIEFKDIHICRESKVTTDNSSTILDHIIFRYCKFSNCTFDKISLNGCDFSHCIFGDCVFNSMLFKIGFFIYSELNCCNFNKCNLNHFDIINTSMNYVKFDHSELCTLEISYCSECTDITIKESKIDIRIAYSKIIDLEIDDCQDKDIELNLFCSNIRILKFRNQNSYPASVRMEHCEIGDITMNGKLSRIIQVSGIGSRKACTMYDAANDHVICGCWSTKNGEVVGGSLDEFEKRVSETYPLSPERVNNFYREEYMNAIELFKVERERYKNVDK